MKTRISLNSEQGLTLVELLVACAIILVLGFIMFGIPTPAPQVRALRIQCVNNLKQVGIGARVWAGDYNGKFPWQISRTNGGSMEFTTGPNVWRTFQVMSNEITMPKVLICPADDRCAATNFTYFSNSNISYFLSLDAANGDAQTFLSGDRNLTNGTLIEDGILNLTPNHAAGWTAEMHKKCGNVAFADGHLEELGPTNLQGFVAHEAIVTNRLLMPVLEP